MEIKLDYRNPMALPMLRILPPPWDFRMMTSANGLHDTSGAFSDKYEPIRKLSMVQVQPPRNPNKPFTSFGINDILQSNGCRTGPQQNHRHLHKHSAEKHMNNVQPRHSISKQDNCRSTRAAPRHAQSLHRQNQHNNINDHIAAATSSRIVRPWDASPAHGRNSEASSDADDEEINVDDDEEDPTTVSLSLKDVSPLDALMEMANKTFQGLETSEAAGKHISRYSNVRNEVKSRENIL